MAVVLVLLAGVWLGADPGLDAVAGSLVHHGSIQPSQAILVENFRPNYLLFERAAQLLEERRAERVLVHADASARGDTPGAVPAGVVEVMARVARIREFEIIPVREMEPISLNTALQVREYLRREGIESIIVVSPGFRSRRSYLVWSSVLEPAGIQVSVAPVFGARTPENWRETWHGWQEVFLESAKLAYYRTVVL